MTHDLEIRRAYPDRLVAQAVERMCELYDDGPSPETFAARIDADPAVKRAAAAHGVSPRGFVELLMGFHS